MHIIDISKHQKEINWAAVKAAKIDGESIDGVIIRAGYGMRTRDIYFTKNIDGAIAAGFKHIGVYWFSYAYDKDMTRKEAEYCDEVIKPYKNILDLGVYYDWEYDSMNYARENGRNPSKEEITELNRIWCETMSGLGYKAGYYLNLDYSKNHIDESKLKAYRRWFARYTSEKQSGCYIWQYSSKGKIDGINGNVDINLYIGQLSQPNDGIIKPMPLIKKGSQGKAVMLWQIIIDAKVDGDFGDETDEKTRRWQAEHNLEPDGKVGRFTWSEGLASV